MTVNITIRFSLTDQGTTLDLKSDKELSGVSYNDKEVLIARYLSERLLAVGDMYLAQIANGKLDLKINKSSRKTRPELRL